MINTKKTFIISFIITQYIQDLESDTINKDFIEDVVDEPQITLMAMLDGMDVTEIVETWRIHRVGGLSRKVIW